jgi:hypothetical protein
MYMPCTSNIHIYTHISTIYMHTYPSTVMDEAMYMPYTSNMHIYAHKADCVWVGRKILEAKGKSRSTTFVQRVKRNFQTAHNGVFPSLAIFAGQLKRNQLYTRYTCIRTCRQSWLNLHLPLPVSKSSSFHPMYVCMYVCMLICMYGHVHCSEAVVCTHAACMHVCMVICIVLNSSSFPSFICMQVCMYV